MQHMRRMYLRQGQLPWQDSIAYEYVPYQETDINPKRKWSYKTNSPIFKMKYDEVAGMLPGIIERGVEVTIHNDVILYLT